MTKTTKKDIPKDEPQVVKEARKELKLIGSIRPHRGHSLFKMNKEGVFKVSEEDLEEYYDYSAKRRKKKLIIEEDTIYVSALNKKNATRKFNQMLASNQ